MSCEEDYSISKESFYADQKLTKIYKGQGRISSFSLGIYDDRSPKICTLF